MCDVHICPVCCGRGQVRADFYTGEKEPISTAFGPTYVMCHSCWGRGIIITPTLKETQDWQYANFKQAGEYIYPDKQFTISVEDPVTISGTSNFAFLRVGQARIA